MSGRTGALALLVLAIVAACGTSAPPSLGAPTTPLSSTSPEIVNFAGDADMNTAPFTLSGDTYMSTWIKEPGCTFGAYLESPTDANFSRSLGGSYSDGPMSGETWAYHVGGPGTFYLQVQGSCRWSLTLTTGG